MQCSTNEVHKIIRDATAKQEITATIERQVQSEGCLYLEAASQWMDENGYPESQFSKHLPTSIIEKIRIEAVQENLLRPSLAEENDCATLDFIL